MFVYVNKETIVVIYETSLLPLMDFLKSQI